MLKEKLSGKPDSAAVEEIAIDGFDHIELCVGNALQASYFYSRALGFETVAYRGLETGLRDEVSYVLKQDHVCMVLTGSLRSDNKIAEHVKRHGDGVKTIALRVRNAKQAYEKAVSRGAKKASELELYEGTDGTFCVGSVHTYGDTVHKFVERHGFRGDFAPGFKSYPKAVKAAVGLAAIDHVVGNVEVDQMGKWVEF